MKYSVYKVRNTINGKCYVGITSRSIEIRWTEHCSRAKQGGRNSRLYDAIRKYGKDNFEVTSIATSSDEQEVRDLEFKYIEELDTFNSGYNCNLGGCGWLEMPTEVKEKIGEKSRSRKHTLAAKQKMSSAKNGNSWTVQNFGSYGSSGQSNPRSKWYLIQDPSGSVLIGKGLRAFCKDHGLLHCKLSSKKQTKGYKLLGTFNDYPEREYNQAVGSAIHPTG